MGQAFVVLNPVAGHSQPDAVRQALNQHLGGGGWSYEVYETTGEERVAEILRPVLEEGVDLVVAAGGDGTVSDVADALACTGTLLGIVPVGTGNAVARDLGIPLDLDGAMALLAGEHDVHPIDAMRIEEGYYVLNVGVGITARVMGDADYDSKRTLGRLAYLWAGLDKLFGLSLRRFTVLIDGECHRRRASEVMVLNSSAIGAPYMRWGPHVAIDDGRLDVYIMRGRTALDYVRITWSLLREQEKRDPNVRYVQAEQAVSIRAEPPLPVQADGDVIGETPVEIRVVPQALRVVVPKDENLD